MYKGQTDARRKANQKYLKESVEDIRIRVPRGQKEAYKAHADSQGESLNSFVIQAMNEAIEASKNPFILDGKATRVVGDEVYDVYYRKRIERDKAAPDNNKEESEG